MSGGKSFKIVNGKLVRRTETERAAAAKLWDEFDKKEAAGKAKSRIPRSTERFIKVTVSQIIKLADMGFNPTAFIFFVVMLEATRHWGKPFAFPVEKIRLYGGSGERGISLRAQYRVLAQLEKVGLVSVRRQPPKPPVITGIL
jgi:hypothetical protein